MSAKIVLIVPDSHVDLSPEDARWLGEHLPPAAVLRTDLRIASEQNLQGGHIDSVEIGVLERDVVKQAILEARGRSETVPDDISALERIL